MLKFFQNKVLFKTLFWFWLIAILVFSSVPDLDVPEREIADLIRSDYLFHFVQYLILAFFFVFWKQINIYHIKHSVTGVLAGLVTGAIDEFHQIFIPGRAFNPVDLILNNSGFIIGFLLSGLLLLIIFRSNKA